METGVDQGNPKSKDTVHLFRFPSYIDNPGSFQSDGEDCRPRIDIPCYTDPESASGFQQSVCFAAYRIHNCSHNNNPPDDHNTLVDQFVCSGLRSRLQQGIRYCSPSYALGKVRPTWSSRQVIQLASQLLRRKISLYSIQRCNIHARRNNSQYYKRIKSGTSGVYCGCIWSEDGSYREQDFEIPRRHVPHCRI